MIDSPRIVAAMVPWTRLKTFVKGYEFSDEKIGSVFGFDGLAEWQKADARPGGSGEVQIEMEDSCVDGQIVK